MDDRQSIGVAEKPELRAWQKYTVIGLCYVSQGIPISFFTVALTAILRDLDVDLRQNWVAFTIFWVAMVKFLWSPVIDRYYIAAIGRRKSWILPGAIGSMLCCFALGTIDPSVDLYSIAIIGVTLGLFASFVDIAADGYAVENLTPEQRGIGNALQASGWAVGAVLGGGGMLLLYERIGWSNAATVLGVAIFCVLAIVLLISEPKKPIRAAAMSGTGKASIFKFLRRKEGFAIIGVAILLCMPNHLVAAILGPMFVDNGMSLDTFGVFTITAAPAIGILGSFSAPILISRLGLARTPVYLLTGLVFLALAFAIGLLALNVPLWVLLVLAGFFQFSINAMQTAIFANIMGWCSVDQPGTDWTTTMSGYAFALVLSASLASWTAGTFGYGWHFVLVAAATSLVALGFVFLRKRIVQHMADAEKAAASG